MKTSEFFDIFLSELEQNKELWGYYKFLNDKSLFEFRKAYFIQRLDYINRNIIEKNCNIFDIGCGYGTTAIFLAMNGYKVLGSTLEFYFEQISRRLDFWKKFGDTSLFTVKYENLFDDPPTPGEYDFIILQDVLHHLEPLDKALGIIKKSLKPSGKLLACEENGDNIMNNLRLFLKRGNKRIISIYDEKLKKDILLGNENIRNIESWEREFQKAGLFIDISGLEYIRLYPPFAINSNNYNAIIIKEQNIWRNYPLIKRFFYHGVNFTVNNILPA